MTKLPPLNLPDASSSPADSRARLRSLPVILVVALLGRLLVLVNVATTRPHDWLFSHPWEMGLLANSLLHGLGYSSPFGVPTGPTAIIAPVYPTLIAAVFFVFGSDTFASEIAIIALQILVALVTIWLMMRICRKQLDDRTAILAGAFWAVSLPLLWIPAIFWETSLSACALPAMVLLALGCRRQPTIPAWILLGSFTAIMALTNPALLPSLLAMMAWVDWQTRRVARTAPLVGLLALLLLLLPWTIRNAYCFHAFIPVRSNGGGNLWIGNRPGATGFLDDSLFPMYNHQEMANYVALGEIADSRLRSTQAWDYIRAHPAIFIRLSLRRCFRFWAGTGSLGGPPIYEFHALLTTLLGFAGLVFLFRNRMRAFALLMALPMLLFPLPYYITHAEFRYRVILDPLLTILAAYAVTQLATQLAARWPRTRPSS
jgi:4-amino-4-deoxy-L-arabinose transferase-like glycosyltransferase